MNQQMNPIPYGKQHIDDDDIKAVIDVLKADFLTQGPAIDAFETAFANYVGSKYAVAVSNGTAALHLSALSLEVNETSKVITTPMTFAASANCIRYCGGQVEFIDIDEQTGLIDLVKLETLLANAEEGEYQGVIPVNYAGLAVDLEKLNRICAKNKLWIIEDACHAPGGYFIDSKGVQQLCGNGQFADLSVFSFHPVKHIASGEGGMITTNNHELYIKLIQLRTHGITKDPNLLNRNDGGWYYEMQKLGFNYRLSDIHAALGLSQLKKAQKNLVARKKVASAYDRAFADIGAITSMPYYEGHAYHLYVIQVEDRKGLYDQLKKKNIHSQVHYIPVHTLPYYEQLGWKAGDFPKAENFYNCCLSLPMYPSLTKKEQEYVIDLVLSFVKV